MAEQFLHGVEVIQIDSGVRPIQTVRSSVIGLVGTAPDADPDAFPLNRPVMIAGSRAEAAALDTTGDGLGTLPQAVDAVFDQIGAVTVVIRVEEDSDPAVTISNVIGGVDPATDEYQGIHALLAAEAIVHVTPRILIAPGFTQEQAVVTEMVTIAERLRAVIIADGPNTTDDDAKTYRQNFGSKRIFLVDPWVTVWDTVSSTELVQPASPRVAGLIAKIDNNRGFWWSPSNNEILGITGTARTIDFTLGDHNSRANLLNEEEVATIIHQTGYRLWGNRTCSDDPVWAFLSVVRTADLINDSLLRAHLWAVDRNITATYIEDVSEGVRAYLRSLKAQGAILGGDVWVDPELNTPENIQAGKVFFDFDFTPPAPAEHITFRSHLVNDYISEIIPQQ